VSHGDYGKDFSSHTGGGGGAIPEGETIVEYLEKVESRITGSSKANVSTLIKRLTTEKYSRGGVRDYILRMSNVAVMLKPLDLAIKDEFLIYLIFNSLLKVFETFEVRSGHLRNLLLCVSKTRRGSSAVVVVLIASTWLSTTKRGRILVPRKKTKGKSWAWAPVTLWTMINASGARRGATIKRIALSSWSTWINKVRII
jgi:hypothetical protein